MRQYKKGLHALLLGVLMVFATAGVASAAQSSSAHYGVDETQFGSGGLICNLSAGDGSQHYCADATLGDTAVGNSSSASYQIQAGGDRTDRDTSLEMIVNGANINIGQLSTTVTKTATASFSVKSYLSSGYVVYTSSPGPQYSSHVLQLLGSATTSTTGNEQFGINLVANGCPANTTPSGQGGCSGGLGADPQGVPDSSFAFGHAAAGYNTVDSYKYHDGDVIAYANQSSGETDYTISYLFNISPVTPAGTYVMRQSLIATATF